MGLDISAHEKVTLIAKGAYEDDSKYNSMADVRYLENMRCFEKHSDRKPDGYYRFSGKRFTFRAGSYSSYHDYTSLLARLDPDGFDLQINFSDCEGFIGPRKCKKLLAAYEKNKDRAYQVMGEWHEVYLEWMKAFRIASNGGVVRFH